MWVEVVVSQVEVVTLYNGWDWCEAAAHLSLTMEGEVLQI